MDLLNRYKRLSLWNKIGFWGAVSSILGLASYILYSPQSMQTSGDNSPIIIGNKGSVNVNK